MAKVIIAGNSVIIKSELALEDVKLISKYAKDKLVINDEDGNPVFGIAVSKAKGNLNGWGATFDVAANEDGRAIITADIPMDATDRKEYVADTYGQAVARLNTYEAVYAAVAAEIKHNRAATIEAIEVVG